MDSILHNRVYKNGINKKTILGYTEYYKPYHLHYITKNYV